LERCWRKKGLKAEKAGRRGKREEKVSMWSEKGGGEQEERRDGNNRAVGDEEGEEGARKEDQPRRDCR
jgi:hypothetical protein